MNDLAGLSGKRAFITGASGVLGTALLDACRKVGFSSVIAPKRSDCDLLCKSEVEAAFQTAKPDIVFHLGAWVAGVQGNMTFSGKAFYENSLMNLNVVEAARSAGVAKVVAAGTAAIYSDLAPLPMLESDLWLGEPHGSEASYAHAKRGLLANLQAYEKQYGLEYGYLICTNLFGENDKYDTKFGHVVPSLIARFAEAVELQSKELVIWGDGSPTRDFLYSSDAAEAFIAVGVRGSGPFNAATGKSLSIKELVEALKLISGYKGDIRWDTSKPSGQLQRSYDTSRLRSIGWRPKVEFMDGLTKCYNWYVSHRSVART